MVQKGGRAWRWTSADYEMSGIDRYNRPRKVKPARKAGEERERH